jgi:hypothetical protein
MLGAAIVVTSFTVVVVVVEAAVVVVVEAVVVVVVAAAGDGTQSAGLFTVAETDARTGGVVKVQTAWTVMIAELSEDSWWDVPVTVPLGATLGALGVSGGFPVTSMESNVMT